MTPTPHTLADLPEAPEYTLARLCNARLQQAGTLPAGVVMDEPFDRDDQCQLLQHAAAQYKGGVAVIPQPLSEEYAEVKTGVLTARLAVAVFVTSSLRAVGGRPMTAQDAASRLMAAVIRALYSWRPQGGHIPSALVRLEGTSPLDLSLYQGLENLTGLALTLSKGVHYA